MEPGLEAHRADAHKRKASEDKFLFARVVMKA